MVKQFHIPSSSMVNFMCVCVCEELKPLVTEYHNSVHVKRLEMFWERFHLDGGLTLRRSRGLFFPIKEKP